MVPEQPAEQPAEQEKSDVISPVDANRKFSLHAPLPLEFLSLYFYRLYLPLVKLQKMLLMLNFVSRTTSLRLHRRVSMIF
jgi:hypothetical protein